MGCLASVNLSISPDKNTLNTNKPPLNKTEIQNETYEDHSCKINNDNNNNNNNNNLNINNVPLDVLKSYQYYITNKNYKSCEIGKEDNKKEKKIKMLKINRKNNKKETNNEINNINKIEDMDVDINIYKKYVIKDNNKKKENKNEEKEMEIEINNDINNSDINNSDKKKNDKVLRKSIEDRITKYNIEKNEKNKELEDSICNLGISYIKG